MTYNNIINLSGYKIPNSYMFNWVLAAAKRMLWKARCEILYDKKKGNTRSDKNKNYTINVL